MYLAPHKLDLPVSSQTQSLASVGEETALALSPPAQFACESSRCPWRRRTLHGFASPEPVHLDLRSSTMSRWRASANEDLWAISNLGLIHLSLIMAQLGPQLESPSLAPYSSTRRRSAAEYTKIFNIHAWQFDPFFVLQILCRAPGKCARSLRSWRLNPLAYPMLK